MLVVIQRAFWIALALVFLPDWSYSRVWAGWCKAGREAVASKQEQEAERKKNMLIFGGVGLVVVGLGLFQFGKDAWSAATISSTHTRQPWDTPW